MSKNSPEHSEGLFSCEYPGYPSPHDAGGASPLRFQDDKAPHHRIWAATFDAKSRFDPPLPSTMLTSLLP